MPGVSWFSFGFNVDAVLTNHPTFRTESATLMSMPDYAPVSHMRISTCPTSGLGAGPARYYEPTFDFDAQFLLPHGFYAMYRDKRANPLGEPRPALAPRRRGVVCLPHADRPREPCLTK